MSDETELQAPEAEASINTRKEQKVEEIIGRDKVRRVLFREFVVQ